jgi:hypothetical protein
MADRLLIVGESPDNAASWGGTLSRFHREGWKNKIYICSRGSEDHVKIYSPWADEVAFNSQAVPENSNKTVNELTEVIKSWKPKIIITHNTEDRFTGHVSIALRVQEAAYMAFRDDYLKGGLECWAGDANWEGPIVQHPNVFVRITQQDLDAKIKMFKALLNPTKFEHVKQWCGTLARFRSISILEDNGLAEGYITSQSRVV